MTHGKKKKVQTRKESSGHHYSVNCSITARNLTKSDLGGVIFGCKHVTIKECISNMLFGLPASHFAYIKNICPGMPLFLFNYSDRKLHGIFEATSAGQMNIDPHGWVDDRSDYTSYPAQVQVKFQKQCHPLLEEQFKPIIAKNYFEPSLFWFELDHNQTRRLVTLFSSFPVAASFSFVHSPGKHSSIQRNQSTDDNGGGTIPPSALKTVISHGDQTHVKGNSCLDASGFDGESQFQKPKMNWSSLFKTSSAIQNNLSTNDYGGENIQPATSKTENETDLIKCGESQSFETHFNVLSLSDDQEGREHFEDSVPKHLGVSERTKAPDLQSVITKLLNATKELRTFQITETLKQKISSLELDLEESKPEIQQMNDQKESVSGSGEHVEGLPCHESVFIVGGFDGRSWLPALDLYCPSKDSMKFLKPMNSVRSYSSAVKTTAGLFVLGGMTGDQWRDTVEVYYSGNDQWVGWPSLNQKKGSLVCISVNNKIFAIGGGNGGSCFSEVEILDPTVGRWTFIQPMREKRCASAAAEINGILYVVGGFNGGTYLKSAERCDPREPSWATIADMSSKRGSLASAVLNDKLYALGGYDGSGMLSTVEILDPRMGSWMMGNPMNAPRGYCAAVTIGDTIYTIGGVRDGTDPLDTVECCKEDGGWQLTQSKGVGRRSCFSAILEGGSS